jgi:hypothetical protein
MADPRLSVHQRVQILAQLEHGARWLNALAAWLGQRGVESEADMIDQAARDLLAVCWLLERPIRPKLPPTRWSDGQQTAQSAPQSAYQQVSDQPRQM